MNKQDRGNVKDKNNTHNDDVLRIMKMRIIESFRWQVDIIEPFSKDLGISEEELKEIFIRKLDMSSLEALHPRFESSQHYCVKMKVHADLKLCWLCDVMNIISVEESEQIKNKIAKEVLTNDKSYKEAIEDGKKDLIQYLMR